ncbi:hypothetical protein BJ742DRAFT_830251 [Cladochytrium replicatum]|nr:hypothetical protein BJ742DRAFT_830251 [Cladochytrium replicatum]
MSGFRNFINKITGEDSLNNLQQNVQQQQGQPNGNYYQGQPAPAAGQPQYGQQYPNAAYYNQQAMAQAQYNEALRQQQLYQQYLQQQQYAQQWASMQRQQQQLQRPVPMGASGQLPWQQPQQVPQPQPGQQGAPNVAPVVTGVNMKAPANQAEGLSNIKYVVGIDFGTTFSGFSVLAVPQDGSNPTKPAVWTNWRDQPPRVASPKTPTLLAYSITPDGAVLRHWGWTVDAVPPRPHIRRIERVKLLLRDDDDVFSGKEQAPGSPTNPEQLTEQIGNIGIDDGDKAGQAAAEAMIFNNIRLPKGLTPTQVIGDYLRSMSEVIVHVVENITKTSGGGGQKIDLQKLQQEALFCFTVPVNWTPGRMEVMRKAAQHAGLIEKAESPNLVFCHEPVAAVLTFAKKMMGVITPGSRALVVDAGGGTVDLFQCTFGRELEVAELTQAAGDFFGASLVDQLFWSFFETQIGPSSYDRLREDSDLRQAYQDVLAKWDAMKREFHEEESTWTDEYAGGYKPIVLPASLCHAIRQDGPEYVAKLPNNGTEVRITLADMKTFFDPAVNRIVEMVVAQLDAAGATAPGAATEGSEATTAGRPIDHLFLVGGFCSNGYLRRRILTDSRVVGRVMNVPTIEQPEGAVLEGAAWYGFDAKVVRSRKARYTLGIKIGRQYDPLLDSKADVVNPTDPPSSWIVYKKFCVFVQRNQTVEVGASFTRDKFILTKDMVAEVMVYGTFSEAVPNDVTDPGCHIVGKFTLDTRVWMYAPEWNREDFSITIEYGKIELWVCARPNLRYAVPDARMKDLEFKTPLIVQGEW